MRELEYTYSEENLCWESESVTLTGDTILHVVLREKGKMIIRRDDEVCPKLFISPDNTEFEITVNGRSKNSTIQIVTSEEPYTITIQNI